MSKTGGQFKGVRGFLWLAMGILLLVVISGSLVYLIGHLFK